MAVMGIISFLPYFNWLNSQKLTVSVCDYWLSYQSNGYAEGELFCSAFHGTNLSLSPDESWLPIASIFSAFYIFRSVVELEAGIRSGDIESFKFIERAWKLISPSAAKEKDGHLGNKIGSIGMGDRQNRGIPTAHESRERLRNSDIFKRKLDDSNDEKQKKSVGTDAQRLLFSCIFLNLRKMV
ncbi:unnamed protein product [Miscanthus lutarioriparius]|uniref:Uncharacterized protein n=1 Tax=Miscanthus lutarioriparius TaxID=422564 RepID=A0A811QQ27_9POAL|nr:unnamed protein product [Miscanthus lutarioriparius]